MGRFGILYNRFYIIHVQCTGLLTQLPQWELHLNQNLNLDGYDGDKKIRKLCRIRKSIVYTAVVDWMTTISYYSVTDLKIQSGLLRRLSI